MKKNAVCLMGPTASGKTDIAVRLSERFPFEIISVDSALVYRGMDIGTAKPNAKTLARAPHRLIDIRDPEQPYSAGEFVRDAQAAMDEIFEVGRIPLLVGGTMMYFRSLLTGIAELPAADAELRAMIDSEAAELGWPALHKRLADVDAEAADRIKPNDSQRIQRALEVWQVSGKTLSAWQAEAVPSSRDDHFIQTALLPARSVLHEQIETRLKAMINNGFCKEVEVLHQRPGLTRQATSMRAVGYRQFWAHIAGECDAEEAAYRSLVATRQLAKRQTTWLRSEQALKCFDPLEGNVIDAISAYLIKFLDA